MKIKKNENKLDGYGELVRSGINTKNIGDIYILDKFYWAGEHTFTHCASQAENERGRLSDLWAVDIYTRKGIDPIKHSERVFIWANNEVDASREAIRFADESLTVLITHIKPLEDRLREPATFS